MVSSEERKKSLSEILSKYDISNDTLIQAIVALGEGTFLLLIIIIIILLLLFQHNSRENETIVHGYDII